MSAIAIRLALAITGPINSCILYLNESPAVRHRAIYTFQVAFQIISLQCYVEIHYSEYCYANSSQVEDMDMSLWYSAIIMHILKMPLTCNILI